MDEALGTIREHLMREPGDMRILKKFVKNMELDLKCRRDVLKLYESKRWCMFSQYMILAMSNEIDNLFVKLMLHLDKLYEYEPVQFHRWWRRMKAMDLNPRLSYYSQSLMERAFQRGTLIQPDDVMRVCSTSNAMFENYKQDFNVDRNVEMNLRAKLGVSMSADIPTAWKKWVMTNHPDKGGDTAVFVLVKAAYDEWCALQTT